MFHQCSGKKVELFCRFEFELCKQPLALLQNFAPLETVPFQVSTSALRAICSQIIGGLSRSIFVHNMQIISGRPQKVHVLLSQYDDPVHISSTAISIAHIFDIFQIGKIHFELASGI